MTTSLRLGPTLVKIVRLMGVVSSMSPPYRGTMRFITYRREIESVCRRSALGAVSAFNAVSTDAALTVAAGAHRSG